MAKNKLYRLDETGSGIERVKAHDYADVYSNHVEFIITDRDIRMVFGHFLGLDEGKMRIKEQISIVMNHEQTRQFSMELSEAIKAFEDKT